jgi:hypothetical protein
MFYPIHGRACAFAVAALVLIACLIHVAGSSAPAETSQVKDPPKKPAAWGNQIPPVP